MRLSERQLPRCGRLGVLRCGQQRHCRNVAGNLADAHQPRLLQRLQHSGQLPGHPLNARCLDSRSQRRAELRAVHRLQLPAIMPAPSEAAFHQAAQQNVLQTRDHRGAGARHRRRRRLVQQRGQHISALPH